MWIYYLIMLLLFGLAWTSRCHPRNSRLQLAFVLPLMAVFVGGRWAVGCDFFAYKMHYDSQTSIALGENIPSLDPFYWLLIDMLDYLGLPFQSLIIVTAVVFFTGFWVFARRFASPMSILAFSFPVLIFAIPMSATRQALAMGFLLFAFGKLIDRRYLSFTFFVVLAALFHSSAIIFMVFLPISILGGSMQAWLLALPIILIGLFMASGSEAYMVASDRYIVGGNEAAGAFYRTFLLFVVGLYYHFAMRKNWKQYMPDSYPVVNISALLLIGSFPASFIVPTVADRFGYYLFAFAAAIISGIPFLVPRRADQLFLGAAFCLSFFFIGWSMMSYQVQMCYIPYSSWLFGLPE